MTLLTSSASLCPLGAAQSTLVHAVQLFLAAQCALTENYPNAAHPNNGSSFDFIVVGGGSGGATVAARLATANAKVLLIEAGPDPPQESIIPGFMNAMKNSAFDWKFTTVDDKINSRGFIDGVLKQPRGKLLGGCSSISDMVYSRGAPSDYDAWASFLKDDHWGWNNVLKYFMKTENITDEVIINNPQLMKLHGTRGEIVVSGSNVTSPGTQKFLDAFEDIGFEVKEDMTNYQPLSAGLFLHTIKNGQRVSPLTALLTPAYFKTNNLKVLKDAFVSKVLIENNNAYGVEVMVEGYKFHFLAKKEVIVSAGAYNTPKLLMLSGIGPKEHLEELSIEVVKDAPVGDNLIDHVMALLYIAADPGTCSVDNKTVAMDIIRYMYNRSGPYATNDNMVAYLSLNNLRSEADFAYYPSCMPVNADFAVPCSNIMGLKPEICAKLVELNQEKEILTVAVVLLSPKSRGQVRLRSADPMEPPLIYPGLFSHAGDLEKYPDAVKVVERLMKTEYFKSKNAEIIDFNIDGCDSDDIEGAKCRIRAMSTTAWHSLGTASMGRVLDARLRVGGVGGLRVADAAGAPLPVRGNTAAPVVMLAEQASDFIINEYNLS